MMLLVTGWRSGSRRPSARYAAASWRRSSASRSSSGQDAEGAGASRPRGQAGRGRGRGIHRLTPEQRAADRAVQRFAPERARAPQEQAGKPSSRLVRPLPPPWPEELPREDTVDPADLLLLVAEPEQHPADAVWSADVITQITTPTRRPTASGGLCNCCPPQPSTSTFSTSIRSICMLAAVAVDRDSREPSVRRLRGRSMPPRSRLDAVAYGCIAVAHGGRTSLLIERRNRVAGTHNRRRSPDTARKCSCTRAPWAAAVNDTQLMFAPTSKNTFPDRDAPGDPLRQRRPAGAEHERLGRDLVRQVEIERGPATETADARLVHRSARADAPSWAQPRKTADPVPTAP